MSVLATQQQHYYLPERNIKAPTVKAEVPGTYVRGIPGYLVHNIIPAAVVPGNTRSSGASHSQFPEFGLLKFVDYILRMERVRT